MVINPNSADTKKICDAGTEEMWRSTPGVGQPSDPAEEHPATHHLSNPRCVGGGGLRTASGGDPTVRPSTSGLGETRVSDFFHLGPRDNVYS